MKKFASAHRPEAWKKPRRDELKKSLHSDVKALSVMRIWKRFPKRQHLPNRMIEVAKCTGYKACVEEAAAYKERCKEGRGDEPMSGVAKVEMSSARKQARDFFQQLFPGELPLNW